MAAATARPHVIAACLLRPKHRQPDSSNTRGGGTQEARWLLRWLMQASDPYQHESIVAEVANQAMKRVDGRAPLAGSNTETNCSTRKTGVQLASCTMQNPTNSKTSATWPRCTSRISMRSRRPNGIENKVRTEHDPQKPCGSPTPQKVDDATSSKRARRIGATGALTANARKHRRARSFGQKRWYRYAAPAKSRPPCRWRDISRLVPKFLSSYCPSPP